jgi:hypothetical protein
VIDRILADMVVVVHLAFIAFVATSATCQDAIGHSLAGGTTVW